MRPQTERLDMSNISMTPSDVIGAIQRAVSELNAYLGQPAMAVSVPDCKAHLDRVIAMFDALAEMQAAIVAEHTARNDASGEMARAQATGNGAGAHAS